jgi:hypothetical protein
MTGLIAIALYGVAATGFYLWATKTALPHQDEAKTGPSPNPQLRVVEGGSAEEDFEDREAA